MTDRTPMTRKHPLARALGLALLAPGLAWAQQALGLLGGCQTLKRGD